jgi:hypothetical protein
MLRARPGERVRAENWLDCLRRCEGCRVGVSNAMSNPTIIFDDPRLNIPEEVLDGVLQTLSLALNVRNRENKKRKFGFSTSEDALTWTLFKFLSDSRKLTGVPPRESYGTRRCSSGESQFRRIRKATRTGGSFAGSWKKFPLDLGKTRLPEVSPT